MTAIKQADLIQSVADALQFISFYHPADYIRHLASAYRIEKSDAARDAIAQILTNSRMCAEGKRPICQDTGIVNVFLKIGMNVSWPDATVSIEEMVNEGVRRAYLNPENPLRGSIVADPEFARKNTKDNTPAVVHMTVIPGNTVEVTVAAKGGGSENKSKLIMLNPSESVVDWVLKTVPTMGAGWCPPGMFGHRNWRHGRKSGADGQGGADGTARHVGAARSRAEEQDRRTANRVVRESQCAGHRRSGSGRADHRTRCQDQYVSDTRSIQTCCDDSELRSHPPCAFCSRWFWCRSARAAFACRLAGCPLASPMSKNRSGST